MKKCNGKFKKYFIIISILVAIATPIFIAHAEPEVTSLEGNSATVTAVLYDTEEYSSGTGTELTEEGATVSNWTYATSKYLQIDPSVPNDGNTYKIIVDMPHEFFAQITEVSKPSGYKDVKFTKNESFTVNTDKTYELKKYSGCFEYTLGEGQTSGTIQLAISYDDVLWANQANQKITKDDVKPIVVTLKKVDGSNNETVIKEVSINKAISGEGRKYSNSMYYNGTSISSNYTPDQTIKLAPFFLNSDQNTYKFYFKKLYITYKLPKYTDADNNVYYLTPDLTNIEFTSFTTPNYEIDSSLLESDGIVKIKISDVVFNSGTLLKLKVCFPEELKAVEEKNFAFTGGNVAITGDAKNEVNSVQVYSYNIARINYTKNISESISISANKSEVSIDNRPSEAVSRLGTFLVSNNGTGKSGAKTIKVLFDINDTGKINVTTVNILADKEQEKIQIKYTLVDKTGRRVYLDENGNRVEEGTIGATGEWTFEQRNAYKGSSNSSNLYNRLQRSFLPEIQRQYYFKSLTYTINSIEPGMKLYSTGGAHGTSSGGNYFGYISENAQNGDVINSQMEIINEEGKKAICPTTSTSTNNTAYCMQNVNLNKNSIYTGESLVLSGDICLTNYPYGNSAWLRDVVVGVVIPNGISINEKAITATFTASGRNISNIEVLPTKSADNGNCLWRIKIPNEYFGYYGESLGRMNSDGATMRITMQLDTAIDMNTTVLQTKDMIYAAGKNQINSASGAYNWARKVDKYDLNENNSPKDYIGGVRDTYNVTCQITPHTATLDINDSISINSNGTILPAGTNTISSKDDIVTYNLDVACTSGGQVNEFLYFIPIPKKSQIKDSYLVKNDITDRFEFEMQGPITSTGTEILKIEYGFDESVNYSSAKDITNWYTKEQIESDESLRFENVTIARLSMIKGIINNGDSCRLSVNLKYAGENYKKEVGLKNEWSSCGFFSYENNGRVLSGDFDTKGVSVSLKCSIEDLNNGITLTAAKDMNPQGEGNVNTYTKNDLGDFVKSHNLKITDVETYNVDLQTKQYIIDNKNMSGTDANKTYAITVALNGGSEYSITSSNNTSIGTIQANTMPELTYKIYNADALSDNLNTRYIVVTLESDNGLKIKQKVNVNVEANLASEVVPSIMAGKSYVALNSVASTVTISKNAAFTSQMATTYIPNMYGTQKLVYSTSLPINTTITLVNMRAGGSPTYWYYKVSEENKSEINLNMFKQIGTTSGKNYECATGADPVEEKFIVVTDFGNCTNYLEDGANTIKLVFEGNSVSDFTSTNLEFVIDGKRAFELSVSNTSIGVDEELTVSYTLNEVIGSDTKYSGKKLSLIITGAEDIPLDTFIVYGSNRYYLNSNKEFIIPLNEVKSGTSEIKMKIISEMLPTQEKSYNLNIALWVSATANASAPKLGQKVAEQNVTLSKQKDLLPSLKVESMSKRIIKTNELQSENTIKINYKKLENCSLTLELQHKIGNGYQKVTNKLNQVNGITTHTMGVFAVQANQGENNINIVLSSSTEIGTYRLMFRIIDNNGNEIMNIPYNFMVTNP